jgi:hypothetical protein
LDASGQGGSNPRPVISDSDIRGSQPQVHNATLSLQSICISARLAQVAQWDAGWDYDSRPQKLRKRMHPMKINGDISRLIEQHIGTCTRKEIANIKANKKKKKKNKKRKDKKVNIEYRKSLIACS